MVFENEIIDPAQLPQYESVPLTPIDPLFRNVILWNWLFTALITSGLVAIFFLPGELRSVKWIAVAIGVVFVVLWGILQLKSLSRRAYALRTHDVIYRHGIISITTVVIPFNRIQHVALKEGVFSRIYGLAAIQVYTAGGSSADVSIAGLKKEDAEKLKEAILERIK